MQGVQKAEPRGVYRYTLSSTVGSATQQTSRALQGMSVFQQPRTIKLFKEKVMPFIQFLLVHVPTVLLGFIIIFIYVFLTIISLVIIRKYYPTHRRKSHNDIAGFIFATLGVIYAVILAFTVVVTWGDFDKASEITNKEANFIASLYQNTAPFPAEFTRQIDGNLREYVNAIVSDEWQKMAKGKRSSKVEEIQGKLVRLYSGFQPKNEIQKIFLTESVKKMNEASEMRRLRLVYAATGIHPLLYAILIAGSIITIAFTMLFGTENHVEQLIMTASLAAMIAFALFTVVALDYPFTGTFSIEPDALKNMLAALINN
jgi:hypothetical protein